MRGFVALLLLSTSVFAQPVFAQTVLAQTVLAQQGLAKGPIVATDLLKIKRAAGIDVSRDGRFAIFEVQSAYSEPGENDKAETKFGYRQHIWRIDLATPGATPIQLTFGDRNDGSATISPDGKTLAFVRVEHKKPQVWVMPLDVPGEAHPLTKLENGASQPVWRPDGKALLVSSAIPFSKLAAKPYFPLERPKRDWMDSDPKKGEARPDGDLKEIRNWLDKNSTKNDPVDINRINFLGELNLQEEPRVAQLHAVEFPAGKTTQVTKGSRGFSNCHYSPDATRIACVSEPEGNENPDRVDMRRSIWSMAADGSDLKAVLDNKDFAYVDPQFTPDGKSLLFTVRKTTDAMYSQARLARSGVDGSNISFLTPEGDSGVQAPKISSDGRSVLYSVLWHGGEPLREVRLDGHQPAELVSAPVGVSAFAEGGGTVVLAEITAANPNELYVMRNGGKPERFSELNTGWLANKELSMPVEKWTTRPDGLKVQMWVMNPTNAQPGKKYPWVLDIHGGPSAMWGPGEFSMWHEFQILCSFGYGVVYSNPRGSGGYGYEFQRANYQNWGEKPSGDVLAALDEAVKDNPMVDSNRLFITGGSYAGYLTAWIIGHDQRFKAAVAQRGVYDLATFFGESNAFRLVKGEFGGYPWEPETKKLLERESPFTYVADIRTPFLIIHGSNDYRTGIAQSEMMFRALKIMNRPVEYLRYPNIGHELTRSGPPNQRMDHMLRIIEFFERYANNDRPAPAIPKTGPSETPSGEHLSGARTSGR